MQGYDASFGIWAADVNEALMSAAGVVAADLPDMPYWDMFTAGISAVAAANAALNK